MSKKIGRNEKCTCGSGKKYKQCCLDKDAPVDKEKIKELLDKARRKIIEEEKVNIINELKNYDSIQLLSIISLLQILPENHGKNIRLEEIQRQAIMSISRNRLPVNIKSLKSIIHKKFPHNHLEDPPENLFTENLMTPAGNMVIFPGLTEGQSYFLHFLIQTINNPNININEQFRKEVCDGSLLLIIISNMIARSFNYTRNMSHTDTKSNDIYFPDVKFIEDNFYKLIFTVDEIEKISNNFKLNHLTLNDFCLDLSSANLEYDNPDDSPIIFKPILRTEDTFIVVSPTTLVFACVNYIIEKAIKYNCLSDLIINYSKMCWMHACFMLDEMGYSQIKYDFPNKESVPIHEGLFYFDSNKVAYVLLKFDDGLNYNIQNPLMPESNSSLEKNLRQRRQEIHDILLKDEEFTDTNFLHLTILLGIGRPGHGSYKIKDAKWESLGFTIHDLHVLHLSERCNNLTFWNFSKVLSEGLISTPFFLDNITYFIENDHSLYSTDERIDNLSVVVGNAIEFRTKAIKDKDEHLEVFPIKGKFSLLPISRESLPVNLPIYSTRNIPFVSFKVCVTSFNRPIWIKYHKDQKKISKSVSNFVKEVCVSIGYWLNEVSEDLISHFSLRRIKPIIISIDICEVNDAWASFEKLDKNVQLSSEIKVELSGHEMTISLNEYFYFFLYRNDNFAERILIETVLINISKLLFVQGIDHSLTENTIREAINKNAPLGNKKKLLLQISDYDIRLTPHHIVPLRELQSFEINRQLDGLGEKMASSPFVPKIIENRDEKINLINKVVVNFYTDLRILLEQYSFEDTLLKLMSFYETAIQTRERIKFETPPIIECFKDHCDIFEYLSKKNKKNVEQSIVIRCLIEHIIAEPSSGKKSLDSEAFDKALASMYNIFNWGSLSDEIKFNIDDVGVSFLPSKRIGTNKSFHKDKIIPFYQKKFNEDIFDYVNSFNSRKFNLPAIAPSRKAITKLFDEAFIAEFNLSIDDFSEIIDNSIFLAFDKDNSVYRDTRENFVKDIKAKVECSKDAIDVLLNGFSLNSRGRVENTSNLGFKNEDFYPWRFNRALSILRRPFIITIKDEIEFVWFGARELIDFKFFLISNIYNGRLKVKSSKMISFLSSCNNQNGKDFNNEVYDYLIHNSTLEVIKREVKINAKGMLMNQEDLGDIDILVIDKSTFNIIAVECKSINQARTPYEMHLELLKFLGANQWIEKAKRRDLWIKKNFQSLQAIDKDIDLSLFKFKTIFLTNEAIPFTFIKENQEFHFTTLYDIKIDYKKALLI